MTEAICRSCSKRWELSKSVEEYDALRCADPDCRSRNVKLVVDGEEPVEAVAFRRYRQGDSPAELVESGLCSPAEARQLRDEFNELQYEYVVLSEDEFAERIETAREEVEAEADKRVQQARREAGQRIEEAEGEVARLQQRVAELEREVDEEWQHGVKDGREVAEAECEERIEEARKEEREAAMERAEERLDDIRETAKGAIADLQAELERERRANGQLVELVRAYKTGDEARIYAAGHRAGVLDAEATEAAKSDGALEVAKALVR